MTVGFDVFDRWFWCFDRRFWWFWQVVLMVLTAGFDGFDVLTVGFDVFDRWFWCFWRMYNKWQQVLMFLMILTGGFDGFDDFDRWFWWFWCFDSRFWCFWWYRQKVFVFEGCIINHFIMTVGFVLWRRCYQEIPLPPIAAYLWLCCEKTVKTVHSCEQKLIVYRIVY